MFTYGDVFFLWEFYSCIIKELITNTVLGISAVFVISLLFVRHLTGTLLVTPTVAMIFAELLGFLELNGKSINCVTTIVLVMSIGLVVDYNLHIVQKYFELSDVGASRNERVTEVLRTMGSSVLLGGLSTFLGILALSFSSSGIFRTFFVALLGVVVLGLAHGLIFMPVVLSIVGPHKNVSAPRRRRNPKVDCDVEVGLERASGKFEEETRKESCRGRRPPGEAFVVPTPTPTCPAEISTPVSLQAGIADQPPPGVSLANDLAEVNSQVSAEKRAHAGRALTNETTAPGAADDRPGEKVAKGTQNVPPMPSMTTLSSGFGDAIPRTCDFETAAGEAADAVPVSRTGERNGTRLYITYILRSLPNWDQPPPRDVTVTDDLAGANGKVSAERRALADRAWTKEATAAGTARDRPSEKVAKGMPYVQPVQSTTVLSPCFGAAVMRTCDL